MKVTRDVPGEELELQQSKDPNGQFGCVLLFLLPFWLVPLIPVAALFMDGHLHALLDGGTRAFVVLFLTVWYGLVGLVTIGLLYGSRFVTRISVDRAGGQLSIQQVGALGLFARARSFPLGEIARISVGTGRQRARAGPLLPLLLRIRGRNTPEESLKLDVEGLDRREELIDFALRIGAAAGLRGYDVTRSDAREIEVTLGPEGATPVPRIDRPANYLKDIVAVKVAVPKEVIPPFDPALFKSVFRVEVWEPGREVRLFKPFQLAVVGCSTVFMVPFAAGGAWMAWNAWKGVVPDLLCGVPFGLVWMVFSLGILVLAVLASLPQLSAVEWATRTITIVRTRSSRVIPFADLTGIETRGVRTHHSGGKNSSPYDNYKAQIWAHARDGGELLAETNDEREDPSTPYRGALPLGVDLAKALGVPHRYTDYK